ncbi:MAG: ABC transporter ATP-binding protein [Sedimenticola sp.]
MSFSVYPGDCLAVIGSNGAGKSTLLKLLAGIFPPDRGAVRIAGRVSSLIEVGAGFHPMLTGRENVYINGAILGMSQKEITRDFDRIVEFSGLESFIDSPVKNYSSGMYVRLGFAVAAHSRPDVLLVDEALAVGDLAFNIRCINHIAEMRQQGTAVLFVTHNEMQLRSAASSCLLIDQGEALFHGGVSEALFEYHSLRLSSASKGDAIENLVPSGALKVSAIEFFGASEGDPVEVSSPVRIKLLLEVQQPVFGVLLELRFWNTAGELLSILNSSNYGVTYDLAVGHCSLMLLVRELCLPPGTYRVAGGFLRDSEFLFWTSQLAFMDVQKAADFNAEPGLVAMYADFQHPVSIGGDKVIR